MRQTLRRLFRPDETQIQAQDAYIACTTQARNPVFYASLGVPDTLDGRFELILLHLWLQLTRWENTQTPEMKRALIEAFFADMDQNLREFGIDMGIKKRMRAMADGYNGRLNAYDVALAETTDDALCAALGRNVFGTCEQPPTPAQLNTLAHYVRMAASQPVAASDWPALSLEAAGI